MRKVNTTIAIIALITSFTACKKGPIKEMRLNGTWQSSSGTGTIFTEYSTPTTTSTIIEKKTWDYDRLKIEKSSSVGGATSISTENNYHSYFTFDKKADTYKYETQSEIHDSVPSTKVYKSLTGCQNNDTTLMQMVTADISIYTTETNEGHYTILGETGDIKKNERLLLEPASIKTVITTRTFYTLGGYSVGTVYINENGTCKVLSTDDSIITLNKDITGEGNTITVTKLTRDEFAFTKNEIKTTYSGNNNENKEVVTYNEIMNFYKPGKNW